MTESKPTIVNIYRLKSVAEDGTAVLAVREGWAAEDAPREIVVRDLHFMVDLEAGALFSTNCKFVGPTGA